MFDISSRQRSLLKIRGGALDIEGKNEEPSSDESLSKPSSPATKGSLLPVTSLLTGFGKAYGAALESRPILTKSFTAFLIFGLSDFLAQKLESRDSKGTAKFNWTRTLSSMGVGLLYFGPAAHFWYDSMFKIFPGTGLVSTLQKSAMGQLFFGPSFTCIFFATGLWQAGQFTVGNWFQKIRQDLPGAWLAGVGFWPLVDLVSYSLIPVQYIPLFVNMCSLVWTIYLSGVANRESRSE